MLEDYIGDVIAKYCSDNGVELVNYNDVGLPVHLVEARALVRERLELGAISEFVLRAYDVAQSTPSECAGILGIPPALARGVSAELVASGFLSISDDGTFAVTDAGAKYVRGTRLVETKSESIAFHYDGLVREVIELPKDWDLYTQREAVNAGLRPIRHIPKRGPNADEVSLTDLKRTSPVRTLEKQRDLLTIADIRKALARYYEAVMAIVRDEGHQGDRAVFFIDGVESKRHGLAFERAQGMERLQIVDEPRSDSVRAEHQSVHEIAKRFTDRSVGGPAPQAAKKIGRNGRPVLGMRKKDKAAVKAPTPEATSQTRTYGESFPFDRSDWVIRVHQHAPMLDWALRNAQERIIIVSPWITPRVVGARFLAQLDDALERGVRLYIGWGIGGDDRRTSAQDELERRAEQSSGLVIRYLGDTHAKVLLVDNTFFVVTSFNWLSFRGDPRMKFREEFGQLNTVQASVDAFADELIDRIDNVVSP